MSYAGDFRLGDTLDVKFTSALNGVPFTLAGSPVISAYLGNSTTQLTAGITLSADFDSVTGLNNVRVVATSGNGYATATNCQLVITTGTINGVSVAGSVVASFSIENRSAVMPTVAARTLDVSAGGEAGFDWGNVGSPTTANNLSGTTVNLTNTVTTYTGNTPQTGDSFARIGALGAGLTALASQTSVNTIDDFLDTEMAAALAAILAAVALLDDPRGEPGQGAPPVSADLVTKVDYVYKFLRNKITQTATTLSVYADDASTVDQKAAVSDDGTTYTRGEFASGP